MREQVLLQDGVALLLVQKLELQLVHLLVQSELLLVASLARLQAHF